MPNRRVLCPRRSHLLLFVIVAVRYRALRRGTAWMSPTNVGRLAGPTMTLANQRLNALTNAPERAHAREQDQDPLGDRSTRSPSEHPSR